MKELINKTINVIEMGAATIGATTEIVIKAGGPAAEYDQEMIAKAQRSIETVLGRALEPIITSGSEDFHYYATKGKIRTAYIGLGADLEPGLHHPEMRFNQNALIYGTKIVACCIYDRLIGY